MSLILDKLADIVFALVDIAGMLVVSVWDLLVSILDMIAIPANKENQ